MSGSPRDTPRAAAIDEDEQSVGRGASLLLCATSSSEGPGRVAGCHAESLRIVERQHVLAHGRENSPGRFAIPIVPPGVIASDAVTGVRVAPECLGAQPCRSNPLSRPNPSIAKGPAARVRKPKGQRARAGVAPSSAQDEFRASVTVPPPNRY